MLTELPALRDKRTIRMGYRLYFARVRRPKTQDWSNLQMGRSSFPYSSFDPPTRLRDLTRTGFAGQASQRAFEQETSYLAPRACWCSASLTGGLICRALAGHTSMFYFNFENTYLIYLLYIIS